MKYQLSNDDREFISLFESCELSPTEFNHRGHIRLAYIYLTEHDDDTAYQLMRDSLIRFITHNGVDISKYHETITRAWVLAVRHFMENDTGSESAKEFIANNPKMLDKEIMMTHYSAELLFSNEARGEFVAPDLDPIPRHDN